MVFKLKKPSVQCTHPTTLLLSVHKGASTFLTVDFAPAMVRAFPGLRHLNLGQEIVNGRTVEDLPLPPTGVVASRVYTFLYDTAVEDPVPAGGRFADKKLVMLRRDPRDVAISLYYSIKFSHTSRTRNPANFLQKRSALEHLEVADGVAEVTSRTAIRQFLKTVDFLARYPQTCLTTYEMLTTDFPAWMDRVASYLEWSPVETQRVSRGLERAVTPPAKENPRKHKRRVTPGNWREVFDDRLRRLFEKEIGRELADAGYTW